MDITKITAALSNARTEVVAAVKAEKGVILNDASTPEQVSAASRSLQALGRIDAAIKAAETKITKAVSRTSPRKKNKKKAESTADNKSTGAAPENKADAKGKK